jgi:hypothetical protein
VERRGEASSRRAARTLREGRVEGISDLARLLDRGLHALLCTADERLGVGVVLGLEPLQRVDRLSLGLRPLTRSLTLGRLLCFLVARACLLHHGMDGVGKPTVALVATTTAVCGLVVVPV